ncbi:MAG: 2-oxoacid:acceptor oxidoreductase subunit alpha [Synergistaceae bacterium]|nr:2-oxoacid:acceptor oxidoreductase subunit alpha [Synergistaceae bacterium]
MIRFPRHEGGDVSVVICGAAGQGIQTVEDLLVQVLRVEGYHVFGSREYMSRVRGGNNSTEIRVSSRPVRALVDRIDLLIPLNGGVRANIIERIDEGTIIIGDGEELGTEFAGYEDQFLNAPVLEEARQVGGKVYASVIAAGILAGLFDVSTGPVESYFEKRFGAKGDKIVAQNREALDRGLTMARRLLEKGRFSLAVRPNPQESRIAVNGTDAVGLGALAGGCNLVTAYPMSPASGVLSFMAQKARDFGVVVEQVEDEIAAINWAVGGAYAGARPLVTTSGGGFALMTEGLSLAAVMEAPVVVHLAQRPGPATGMATRTEQADLELALYGGHGEFPRVIFAPGSLGEAFDLTRRAFDLASRFQSPAIVLTDQYFVNSFYDLPPFDVGRELPKSYLVEAGPDYRRYAESPDGISPMAVPGHGEGLVGADSHEHDEVGHVYEDFHLRKRMNDKRLRKAEAIFAETLAPTLIGPDDYRDLVICWGSTRHIVEEALDELDRPGLAMLHFAQVWPLHGDTAGLLGRAERVVAVEGNATAQLARLIRRETGIEIKEKLLNYSGLQFSVEKVREGLRDLLS